MQKNEKSVNAVTLSGQLSEVICRSTATGDPVANATLIVTDGQSKEGKARFQYLRMVAWKGLATKAAELPDKSLVRISGRIETVSWTDKASGQKRYRQQIVLHSLDTISHLGEVPAETPKADKSAKMTGAAIADAILSRPASSEITEQNPITDADIPF